MLKTGVMGATLLALCGCVTTPEAPTVAVQVIEQDSGVDSRLRGLSAVDAQVAWASGSDGTVLRTLDGGEHWQVIPVPDATALDFRDIEAWDADRAVILSIGPGDASRVYTTENGGRDWSLALRNPDPAGFLDCFSFDGEHGVILGDPVDGHFQLYESRDRGGHWTLRADGPSAATGEAAFAASGTCIAIRDEQVVFVTGGSQARAHYLYDSVEDRARWQAAAPVDHGASPSTGYFSVASTPQGFIVVGGDYQQPAAPGLLATLTLPGAPAAAAGDSSLEAGIPPSGYRSAIDCAASVAECIATGPSGTDWWDGTRWTSVSPLGFDAVDLVGNSGWVSGEGGRIARLEIIPAATVSGNHRDAAD